MKLSPRTRIVGYIVIVLAGFFLFSQLIDFIPPKSLTVTRMWVTKRRIIQFVQHENRLPNDLSELLPMPGYNTQTRDAWGRPLVYKILPTGEVLLESYGKDGVAGGTGDDADLTGIFAAKTPQGDWIRDELQEWTKAPILANKTQAAP